MGVITTLILTTAIAGIVGTGLGGLIGALLVGVNFAKSLAFANNIPLVPVCHIWGHIAANYFTHPDLKPPFLALVASGGHTSIVHVKSYTEFETIGRTRDDAIGEAFEFRYNLFAHPKLTIETNTTAINSTISHSSHTYTTTRNCSMIII